MSPVLDPVAAHAVAAALAAVFLMAALGKLRDREAFRLAIENYELVPAAWSGALAWLLATLELVAGALLLPLPTRVAGALLAIALLVAVSLAVAINLARGRTHIDCGCGTGSDTPLRPALLLRNAVLIAAAALLALLPVASRETVWLDALAAVFLALFLFGLSAVANQLIAHHARLAALRNLP